MGLRGLAGKVVVVAADGARRTADEITEAGGTATGVPFDLAEPDSVAALFDTAAAIYGGVDASFNVGAAEGGHGDFVGIPVPLAALIWSTALLVQPSAAETLGVILVTAAAMVLPIRIPRPTGAGLAVFVLWPLAVGIGHLAFAR